MRRWLESASLHAKQQGAHDWRNVQLHHAGSRSQLQHGFTQWIDQQEASFKHAPHQDKVKFQMLEIQLADDGDNQLTQSRFSPLNQLEGKLITRPGSLKNQRGCISTNLQASGGIALEEVLDICNTCVLDEGLSQ